jgi:hypothetical protein
VSSWRVRLSYGYGAAHAPLAPVFAPGPFSVREPLAASIAAVAEEMATLDRGVLARRSAAAFGLALSLTLALVALVPPAQERDLPTQELVLIVPEPVPPEALSPEPEPEPLVEPEPAPPPLAAAEPVAPPPVAERVAPPPAPAARPEPVRAEPAPKPAARLRIDAIASAPQPAPLPPERVERAPAPPRTASGLRIDPVAPSFPVAATAAASAVPAPLRTAARAPARSAPPVAFSLEPVAAAPAPAPPPLPARERAAPARSAPGRTAAVPLPRFDPVAPPARYADAAAPIAPPPPVHVARTAARGETVAPAPSRSFQGVPLGSLAACVSDREEDSLKLSVMATAGTRSSCSSRAGSYRFIETKNLNAFLMWIERNPERKAADRCIELRLALECLAGTLNRRTDNG